MSFSAGSPLRIAVRATYPLLDAERARGNTGGLEFGTMRDSRGRWQLKHQIDGDAILAQFDLGEGVAFDTGWPGGRISFTGREGDIIFAILGRPTDGFRGASKRAAWWEAWNAGPRPRTPFPNPFADVFG